MHDSELDTNSEDELDDIRYRPRAYFDNERQANDSGSDTERDVPDKKRQSSEMMCEKLTRLMVTF